MAISAHVQDVVTTYLRRHAEEQPLLQPLLDRIAAGQNVTDRNQFEGHITTSGIVINDAGDVLLVHHLASGHWIQPGGHVEDTDTTLGQAVRREIAEETGVTGLEPFADDAPDWGRGGVPTLRYSGFPGTRQRDKRVILNASDPSSGRAVGRVRFGEDAVDGGDRLGAVTTTLERPRGGHHAPRTGLPPSGPWRPRTAR
ncbi:NUDIX domain-containing protein [Streptomyces europaeiscabiei]|uniref:NUDIX domain-containing protein n=1 Tax=Streptomyces europaeiscabiei TaxID=146819 RepID=UPI0038F72DF3